LARRSARGATYSWKENVMTLWVILTIMTSVTAVLVSAPFLRRLDQHRVAGSEGSVAVYLDQLIELEKDAAAGLIDTDQAEAARAEIKRRILAADRAQKPLLARLSLRERNLAGAAVAGVVTLGSVALYASNGSPTLPAASAQIARMQGSSAVEELAAATRALDAPQLSQPQSRLGSVDEMIDRVVARVSQNPNDVEGWRMLGWSYFNTEHFAQSAAAYAKAFELNPNDSSLGSAYGEALVRAAEDRVTDDAKAVFEKTLKVDGKDARARFFMGLAKEQAGNKTAALDDWVAILNEADSNETWFGDLRQRVSELSQDAGIDVSTRLHRKNAAATGGVLAALQQQDSSPVGSQKKDGPTADDVRNADAMPPADRAAMIRGMVDGLATRLEQSPGDVEGWIKLIRSRKVLGETKEAAQALQRALDVFKTAPQEREQIVAVGREMGLTQ
jgi:cytochrome c-type biogenesis protein CcmH